MFAIHHKRTRHHHTDVWEFADRTAAFATVAAVLFATAWLGMTF